MPGYGRQWLYLYTFLARYINIIHINMHNTH